MRITPAIQKIPLLFVVTLFLLTSCESIDQIPIDNPHLVASRSCNTITQSWIDQLKALSAPEYSVAASALEVSALELTSDTSYIYHSPEELEGTVVEQSDDFLLLVTRGGLKGNIIGYYNPSSLSFCTSPDASYIIKGSLDAIAEVTIEIIGADSDVF